jgi:hypothetical protein
VIVGLAAVVGTVIAVMDRWMPISSDSVITIDAPNEGAAISRCYTFRGAAPHRDGMVLWADVHSTIAQQYYFQQPLYDGGDHWQMQTLVGDTDGKGVTFKIDFFYIDLEESKRLEGFNSWMRDLPTGAKNVVTRTVVRTGNSATCG